MEFVITVACDVADVEIACECSDICLEMSFRNVCDEGLHNSGRYAMLLW